MTATAVVVLPVALHVRPAALVARAAGDHRSAVTVDGADARVVLALLTLGAAAGRAVRIEAVGEDEDAALDAVVRVLRGEVAP